MNNQIKVSRTTVGNKRVIMVKSGEVGIQLTEQEAYHVVIMIATLCGGEVLVTENKDIKAQKVANENSTREKPLGV